MSKDKDLTQKMFDYIALLEKTNDELISTLKRSAELLAQFKEWVPNPQGWQDMLDAFQDTIKVGERIVVTLAAVGYAVHRGEKIAKKWGYQLEN